MATDTIPEAPETPVEAPVEPAATPAPEADGIQFNMSEGDREELFGAGVPEADPIAPPVEPTPEPTETPEQFDLRQELEGLGFQNLPEDPVETQRRLVESYRQQEQEAARARQEAQQAQLLWQMQQQQAQQPPEPKTTTEQKAENWWSPPAVPNGLSKYQVRNNETGEVGWADNTPAEVRLQAEQYSGYIDKWVDDLSHRPHEVLPQIIQQEVEKYFDTEYTRRTEEREIQDFNQQIQSQYGNLLYETDHRTNQVALDAQGRPIISASGQQLEGLMNQAAQMGIDDPRNQWQYAFNIYSAKNPVQPNGPVPTNGNGAQPLTVEQQRMQAHMQHLQNQSTTPPDRGGSLPLDTESPRARQNEHQRPGQDLIAMARAAGALP